MSIMAPPEKEDSLDHFALMTLDLANNPGNKITHRYVLHPTSVDLASLVSHFSSRRAHVPGSLIDADFSACVYSRPKLI